MLNKEKERLLKEDERLCRRKDAIKKRMEEIDLEMNKPQEVPQGRIKDSGNISFSENAFTQKKWRQKRVEKDAFKLLIMQGEYNGLEDI